MASFFLSLTVFFASARLYGSSVSANCLFVYRFCLAASLSLAFSSVVGKVRCVRAGSGALQPLCVQQVVQNGRCKQRPLTKRCTAVWIIIFRLFVLLFYLSLATQFVGR